MAVFPLLCVALAWFLVGSGMRLKAGEIVNFGELRKRAKVSLAESDTETEQLLQQGEAKMKDSGILDALEQLMEENEKIVPSSAAEPEPMFEFKSSDAEIEQSQ